MNGVNLEINTEATTVSPGYENHPLVSFILLTYNQERFIREAVEGALAQTYTPLEIIISDDCSTDNTNKIIQNLIAPYSGPHKIISINNHINVGICAHVNKVIDKAKGELLVFAAGDDISEPKRVEILVHYWLLKNQPSAILSQVKHIDSDGNLLLDDDRHHPQPQSNMLTCSDPYFIEQVEKNYYYLRGASLAYSKKDIFADFPPLPENLYNEDQALSFRAIIKKGILFINDKLVRYRQHDDNLYNRTNKTLHLSLQEREKKQRTLFLNKINRFQCHLADLDKIVINDELEVIGELRKRLQTRIILLKIKKEWWEISIFMKVIQILKIFQYGATEDKIWATKRLMPFWLFKFIHQKKEDLGKPKGHVE